MSKQTLTERLNQAIGDLGSRKVLAEQKAEIMVKRIALGGELAMLDTLFTTPDIDLKSLVAYCERVEDSMVRLAEMGDGEYVSGVLVPQYERIVERD